MNIKDLSFLKNTFQNALSQVENDELCIATLKRKFIHSQKVWQNGLMLIKSGEVPYCNIGEFEKQCEQALIFHDIGRFEEVVLGYKNKNLRLFGQKYDHGVLGSQILAQTQNYNDIKIILSVRHHGHMIESFYDDPEYQKLEPEAQKQCTAMIKLVRDADKLDLYRLHNETNSLENDVFFHCLPENLKYQTVSEAVRQQFFAARTIRHSDIKTMSDRILGCISWQFDFNYPLTLKIYHQRGYFETLIKLFTKYCPDKSLADKVIDFIENKKEC